MPRSLWKVPGGWWWWWWWVVEAKFSVQLKPKLNKKQYKPATRQCWKCFGFCIFKWWVTWLIHASSICSSNQNNEGKPPNNINPRSYYFELPLLAVIPVNFVQICQENCWTNIPEAGPELENTAAVIDGENKAGWHVILICQYSWWSEVVWLCLSSDGLL